MAMSRMNDDQFRCSICLDVFSDPVSISCGHNFCQTCINSYWDITEETQCPLCKRAYFIRPEVCINTIMKDLVEEFKKMRGPNSDEAQLGEVASNMCSEDGQGKLVASKSCLDGSVHVKFHQKVPGFQKHPFKEPLKNPEEGMYKKHQPLLKTFCKDDNICVCKFCMVGEHKNCSMVPLDEEDDVQKSTHPVSSVHGEFYQKVPGFQKDTHKDEHMYKKHQPSLKAFCEDDKICVCKFCMVGEHKNCSMVPRDEEDDVKKSTPPISSDHVGFYRKVPGFQRDTHKDEHIYKKHGPPLKTFSGDDNNCVHKFCMEGNHKSSSMVPLDEEDDVKKSTPPCMNVCMSKNRNVCKEGPGNYNGYHQPPLLPMSQSPAPPYPMSYFPPMDTNPSPPPPGFTCMMYYPPNQPPPMPMPVMPPFGMSSYPYPPPHPHPYP